MILNRSFASPIVNAGFQYVAPTVDTTPNAITGQTITNAALNTVIEFNPVQVTGINAQVIASITNGEMRVSVDNGVTYGAYSAANQPVNVNDYIQVRTTSSAVVSTSITSGLSIGSVNIAFNVITINGNLVVIPAVYLTAKSRITIASSKKVKTFHDGVNVPDGDPKSPNSEVWYGFELLGFEPDETVISAELLIDGKKMIIGQAYNGITFLEIQSNGINLVKVRLKGGILGTVYRLTLRFGTPYVPSDDRSQDILIKQL